MCFWKLKNCVFSKKKCWHWQQNVCLNMCVGKSWRKMDIFLIFLSEAAAYSLRVLLDISGYIGCLAAGMNRGAGREKRGRARWQWFLSDKNIQFLAPVQTAAAAVVKEPAWLFIITSAQSCEEFTIHFTLCWCWYAELGGRQQYIGLIIPSAINYHKICNIWTRL